MNENLQNFREAFRAGGSSCYEQCGCGREFYNLDGDWDDDYESLVQLQEDPDAKAMDHDIGFIEFEGREYVFDCDCWHERAKKIVAFIDTHDYEIAKYLSLKKERLKWIANSASTVE